MVTETQRVLLEILGAHLFGKPLPDLENVNWTALLKEAEAQAVFAIVYATVEKRMPKDLVARTRETYFSQIAASVRNAHQHANVHKLLSAHGIPYVVLKGMASASYYPKPLLRAMGDVDFLVAKEHLPQAEALILEEGFQPEKEENHPVHLAFRKNQEVLEMHWEPNGIPAGEKGEICHGYFSDILETALLYTKQNEQFYIPDAFHHGLIILLHTAEHMINTGIGLRHLCDWAVFAAALEEEEFRALFEEKLRKIGMWRFAQLVTQVSIRYLGCPERAWAQEDEEPELLAAMISDIFASGNFGKKDEERINEAKMFTTSSTKTVNHSKTALFKALTDKVYRDMPVCRKVKILLPFGWILVGINHMRLIRQGKRPKLHLSKMLSGAKARSEIYENFQLFR